MKILIGVDFSEESLNAAAQGFAMATQLRAEQEDAEVFVAYIEGSGNWHPTIKQKPLLDNPENRLKIEKHTREFLQQHFTQNPDQQVDYSLIIEEGHARKKLPEIAERINADWIFVGRSGSGALARMTLGSTSYTLANAPPCNLAVAHANAPAWQNSPKIAVGIDFSEASTAALNLAIEIARKAKAQLHLVHVIFPAGPVNMPNGSIAYAGGNYIDVEALRTRSSHDIKALMKAQQANLDDVEWHIDVLTGYPKQEMVNFAADNDIDAIVLGTVGRSALSNFLLGSVAAGIVKHSPCTVYLSAPAA